MSFRGSIKFSAFTFLQIAVILNLTDQRSLLKLSKEERKMKQAHLSKTIARKVAGWLMKDIRLNAEAASSGHMYEPELPHGIKSYGKSKNDQETV